MNLGHVSVVSIIGMIISMLIAIGLPVFLMLFVRKKEKAQINFFFIGAAVFVLAALFLEQSCHALVFITQTARTIGKSFIIKFLK